MGAVVRVGDSNAVGGVATAGASTVFVNGRPVVFPGSRVIRIGYVQHLLGFRLTRICYFQYFQVSGSLTLMDVQYCQDSGLNMLIDFQGPL